MDERKDIYQQPEKPGDAADLPAYEKTPDEMRRVIRIKTILFSALIAAFLIFAGVIALKEARKAADKSDLRDMLATPNAPSNPVVRLTPVHVPTPNIDDFSFQKSLSNTVAAKDISPQKISEAMAEVRAANEYLKARDWDHAEAHAMKALEIWPDMNEALRLRGVVFTQMGRFDEAIEVLERALHRDPFSAEAFNTLATAYIQKKNFAKAEEILLTALSIRPGYAQAEINLGLLYVLMQKYDLALEQLQAAAPKVPENAAVPNNIGICLIRLGRYEEARESLLDIVKRDPKRAAPYFNIAISYTLQHDMANAMTWVRQGAAQCTPVDVQRFLADRDFETLRGTPEYQAFVREIYPQLPRGPNS